LHGPVACEAIRSMTPCGPQSGVAQRRKRRGGALGQGGGARLGWTDGGSSGNSLELVSMRGEVTKRRAWCLATDLKPEYGGMWGRCCAVEIHTR